MQRCEIDERQPHLELRADQLALLGRQCVPLVDADHERTPALGRDAQEARVLLGDRLLRIDQRDHHVRRIDRLQRLDDAELLHRSVDARAAAHTRRIDERVAHAVALEGNAGSLSRVVPGSSLAITRSSPSNRLISVDLPTFGRPMTATRMPFVRRRRLLARRRPSSTCPSGHRRPVHAPPPSQIGSPSPRA